MKDFLTSVFPNYTEAMYEGDEPCGNGHELIGGGYADRWECKYGVGETSGEDVLCAYIIINRKIQLFICQDCLRIVDNRYAGKTDVWVYDNNGELTTSDSKRRTYPLEAEKIEQVLSTKFSGLFWKLVQNRAREIYKVKGVLE